ncbi:MAG: MFS transporter [Ruminococcaceae bacterium]|nr:MFS transporter [Oscillospiraceae bacterium]
MTTRQARRMQWICFVTMALNGLYATSGSLVMPLLRAQYSLSYDMGGMLLSALNLGNLLTSFVCGVLAGRIGRKPAVLLLTAGSYLGYLVLSFTGMPILMLVCFFAVGVSKGAVYNMDNTIVPECSENKTYSVNILHACFAIGSLLCAPLAAVCCTRSILCLTLAAVCMVLPLLYIMSPLSSRLAMTSVQKGGWRFLRRKSFWVSGLLIFFEISAETAVSGWIVSYFQDSNIMSRAMAQMMLSLNWILMMAGRLLVAFVPLQVNPRKLVLGLAVGTGASYAVMLIVRAPVSAVLGLCGFALCVAPVQPTVLANLAPEDGTSRALSVLLPIGSAGGIFMPAVTGCVASATGIWGGMAAIAVACVALMICAFLNMRTILCS